VIRRDNQNSRHTGDVWRNSMIPGDQLRSLRNNVPVLAVISHLRISTKKCGMRLAFRCPVCGGFDTAINRQVNLARCFRCGRNFNCIDLVIAERNLKFLEAVRDVKNLQASCAQIGFSCDSCDDQRSDIPSRLSTLCRRRKPRVPEEAGSQLPQVGGKEIQEHTTDWPPPPKGVDLLSPDGEV
jgi:hypothetical protein